MFKNKSTPSNLFYSVIAIDGHESPGACKKNRKSLESGSDSRWTCREVGNRTKPWSSARRRRRGPNEARRRVDPPAAAFCFRVVKGSLTLGVLRPLARFVPAVFLALYQIGR